MPPRLQPNWPQWIASDALWPLWLALGLQLTRWLAPDSLVMAVLATLFFPMFAALVRCEHGARQIRRSCEGALPWRRQVTLAAALVCLMLFEWLVSILSLARDEPLAAWLLPIGCYAAYLGAMRWALAPAPREPAAVSPYRKLVRQRRSAC